ncbi:hypothetical protein QP979_06830, partial [Corynebacterium striatum]|nr:hypothetical protein [Corynebacterium striatum]
IPALPGTHSGATGYSPRRYHFSLLNSVEEGATTTETVVRDVPATAAPTKAPAPAPAPKRVALAVTGANAGTVSALALALLALAGLALALRRKV